jgi:hypothetical protein
MKIHGEGGLGWNGHAIFLNIHLKRFFCNKIIQLTILNILKNFVQIG